MSRMYMHSVVLIKVIKKCDGFPHSFIQICKIEYDLNIQTHECDFQGSCPKSMVSISKLIHCIYNIHHL